MRLHQTNTNRPPSSRLAAALAAATLVVSGCSAASADPEQNSGSLEPGPTVDDREPDTFITEGGSSALLSDGVLVQAPVAETPVDTQAPADNAPTDNDTADNAPTDIEAAVLATLSVESGFATQTLFVDVGYGTLEAVITTEWSPDGGQRWLTVETAAPEMPDDWAAAFEQGAIDALPKVWPGDISFGPDGVDDIRRELLGDLETVLTSDEVEVGFAGDKVAYAFIEVPFEGTLSWYRWDFGTGKAPSPQTS